MRSQIKSNLLERVTQIVSKERDFENDFPEVSRKQNSLLKRSAEIVKATATCKIIRQDRHSADDCTVYYKAHFQYVIKQKHTIYIEEEVENREALFSNNLLLADREQNHFLKNDNLPATHNYNALDEKRISYTYDRLKAVQYAERWWNDYNPAYRKFDVDCTNYVSQCLRAGGAPMWGQADRSRGWWTTNNNWSFSWSVAHSLRWYLANSKTGLQAREVGSPEQLLLGDVICYDFQGDGRYDHTTIVTGKDVDGMPLVNAHTANSRMRYWSYDDSTAYTPNIKYKFFTILDS